MSIDNLPAAFVIEARSPAPSGYVAVAQLSHPLAFYRELDIARQLTELARGRLDIALVSEHVYVQELEQSDRTAWRSCPTVGVRAGDTYASDTAASRALGSVLQDVVRLGTDSGHPRGSDHLLFPAIREALSGKAVPHDVMQMVDELSRLPSARLLSNLSQEANSLDHYCKLLERYVVRCHGTTGAEDERGKVNGASVEDSGSGPGGTDVLEDESYLEDFTGDIQPPSTASCEENLSDPGRRHDATGSGWQGDSEDYPSVITVESSESAQSYNFDNGCNDVIDDDDDDDVIIVTPNLETPGKLMQLFHHH